jgi:hypothetical protein
MINKIKEIISHKNDVIRHVIQGLYVDNAIYRSFQCCKCLKKGNLNRIAFTKDNFQSIAHYNAECKNTAYEIRASSSCPKCNHEMQIRFVPCILNDHESINDKKFKHFKNMLDFFKQKEIKCYV